MGRVFAGVGFVILLGGGAIGLLICGLFLAVDRFAVAAAARRARRLTPEGAELEVSVDDGGVTWARSGEKHSYPWDALRFFVTDHGVLFAIRDGLGFIAVPHRVLTDAQRREIAPPPDPIARAPR